MAARRRALRIPDAEQQLRARAHRAAAARAHGLSPTAHLPGSQAGVLQLQRTCGNARVSRSLALAAGQGRRGLDPLRRSPDGLVQRDPGPAAQPKGGPAQQAPGEEPKGGADPGWVPIHKLIAEQLGDDKIKEHAKTLAGKGIDLLIAQVKDATSEKDFVAKAQVQLLGTMLSEEAKKDAEALAASDAGKAFRDRLLVISKEQPGIVIAAAIAAAAVAYMANADIPELSKKIDILKGLTGEGKLDLGKVQQLTVQQASLAVKYSSPHFSAGVFGAYAGEGDKTGASGGANVAVGPKDIQFKGSLKLNQDGTVKVDLGQAIDVKKFGMETGVSIQNDKMAAIIAVKVGDKDTYVSGKTTVAADGKVALDLGIKAGGWTVSGTATGLGSDKPAGEGSVKGTSIFGLKGLDAEGKIKFGAAGVTSASGGVSYGADTKNGRAFISFKAETVAGENKDAPPIGAQGVIGIGLTFK